MPDIIPPPPPVPASPPVITPTSLASTEVKPGGCQLGCGALMLLFATVSLLGAFTQPGSFKKDGAMGGTVIAVLILAAGIIVITGKTALGRSLTKSFTPSPEELAKRAQLKIEAEQRATASRVEHEAQRQKDEEERQKKLAEANATEASICALIRAGNAEWVKMVRTIKENHEHSENEAFLIKLAYEGHYEEVKKKGYIAALEDYENSRLTDADEEPLADEVDLNTDDIEDDEDSDETDAGNADLTQEEIDARYAEIRLKNHDKPMSQAQVDLIKKLGGTVNLGMSKGEASDYIDSLIAEKDKPTERQMMVLRFWNKLGHVKKGKKGISEWMDEWYEGDPDRLSAWEDYKEEHGDPVCAEEVEIGIGFEYLMHRK